MSIRPLAFSRHTALLAVVLQSLIFTGCATGVTAVDVKPVTAPGFKAKVNGAHMNAPNGTGWYYGKRGSLPPNTVAFYKHFDGKTLQEQERRPHTYFVSLMVGIADRAFDSPEDLGEYLEESTREEHIGNPRFRLIEFSWKVDNSYRATCVRSHAVQEDSKHPSHPGKLLIKENHSTTCLHPASTGYFVQVMTGESRPKGVAARDYSSEVQASLLSLEFTPVEENGQIYVLRKTGLPGTMWSWPTFVDHKFVCKTRNNRFYVYEVEPGAHVVSMQAGSSKEEKTKMMFNPPISIDVEPGKAHYILAYQKGTVFTDVLGTELDNVLQLLGGVPGGEFTYHSIPPELANKLLESLKEDDKCPITSVKKGTN